MKIIDLLNKIANSEEVPKKIKYDNETLYYCERYTDYYNEDGDNSLLYTPLERLNDEVEILEEEKKIPEKLNLDTDELRGKETPRAIDYLIENKINEVIDYLKSKGE